jgi:two-component system, LytTR family, response regulator LytT
MTSDNPIQVLIVEDEALIAETIKMMLQDFGYEISATCYTYEAASLAIKETTFDLLLTDIDLGKGTNECSGLQLAELLKQTKQCPFIFLTAFSDAITVKKAATLLPSAYLVKPINAANVYAAVQIAIENFKTLNPATHLSSAPEEELDYFFVKLGQKMIKILWADVYHMEAIKNYVKIKTTTNAAGVLLRSSLQQVLGNMVPASFKNKFIKINRSEAIARNIITAFGGGEVATIHGNFTTHLEMRIEDL